VNRAAAISRCLTVILRVVRFVRMAENMHLRSRQSKLVHVPA
jgi:hypothetical protein